MASRSEAGIYCIRNTVNGRCYFGSTNDRRLRWRNHLRGLRTGTHHCPYLQHAWAKYGEAAFEFVWLENVPVLHLVDREQQYLDANPVKYNTARAAGNRSFLGRRHTAESRAKMSAASKGQKCSEETKEKLRAANRGKTYSPEVRAKVAAAMTGRTIADETRKRCRKRGYSFNIQQNCWEARAWNRNQQIIHALCDSEEQAKRVVDEARAKSDRGELPPPAKRIDLRALREITRRSPRGKGYSFYGGKWRARANVDKQCVWIGHFDTELEAAEAVAAFRRERIGGAT